MASGSRRVTIEFLGDDKSASRTARSIDGTTSKMGATLKKVGKVAAIGFAAAAAGAVVVGKKILDAGENASTSNARIENIAKSMGLFGKQADEVSNRLVKLAEKTALQTGMDQNAIKETQAKLLTFSQLTKSADEVGGAFDRTTQLAVDMEAAGFGSAQQAAVMLGKALQEPTTGLASLRRVGVTFTEQQQKQIKTLVESGKAGQAQNLMLKAMEEQVGGTAKATANSSDQIKVALSQVAEKIGLKLMPAFAAVTAWIVSDGIPLATKLAAWLREKLGPVMVWLGKRIGELVAFVREHWPQISATIRGVLGTVQKVIRGVVTVVKAIWRKFGGDISSDTSKSFKDVREIVAGAIKLVRTHIRNTTRVIKFIWKHFGDDILTIMQGIWKAVSGVVRGALQIIKGVIHTVTALIKGDWKGVWKGIKEIFGGVWTAIKGIVRGAMDIIKGVMSAGWRVIKAAVRGAWDGIKSLVSGAVGRVVDMVRSIPDRLAGLRDRLLRLGGRLIGGLLGGIRDAMRGIGGWIKDHIVDPVVDAVKRFFGISSPSKVFAGIGVNMIQGLLQGLAQTSGGAIVKKVFGDMPSALSAIVGKGLVAIKDLPGKALNALGSIGGSIGGFLGGLFGGGGGGGSAMALGQKMAAAVGWTGTQWSALKALWQNESGWNPHADNPTSSAFGIPQALTSMHNVGAAYLAGDPAAQIAWGIDYIRSRYGTPAAAWAHWNSQSPHWYGSGLQGGVFTKPTLIGVGEAGPERVDVTPLGGRRMSAGDVLVAEVNVYLDSKQIQNGLVRLKRRNGGAALGLN